MGRQVVKQPNGLFAIYSAVSGIIEHYDANEQEIIDVFVATAAQRARGEAIRALAHVKAGEPETVYGRSHVCTWAQALESDRRHDGWAHTQVHGTDLDVGHEEDA